MGKALRRRGAFGHHQQLPQRRHAVAGHQAAGAGHPLDLRGHDVPSAVQRRSGQGDRP